MCPKDADRMANSVDLDQTAHSTAVWSGSVLFAQIWVYTICPDLSIWKLRLIKVFQASNVYCDDSDFSDRS